MRSLNEAASMLRIFVFFSYVLCGLALKQPRAVHEADMCLSRVAALPKAEGYGALCTSIAALYQQQQTTANTFSALQRESERTHSSHKALEEKAAALEQQKAALEKQNQELMKKLEDQLVHRIVQEKESQTDIKQTLQAGVAHRDAMWKGIVHRLLTEKKALKQEVSQLQAKAQKASTSAVAEHNRAALLEKSRTATSNSAESKEKQAMMQQIQALQKENAQLVQQCG